MERLSIAMKKWTLFIYSADLQTPTVTGLADLCWSVLWVESYHPVRHTVEWGLNAHIALSNHKCSQCEMEWRVLTSLWCVSERSTSLWRKTGSRTAQRSNSCATIGLLWLISTYEAAHYSAGPVWSTSVSNVWCVPSRYAVTHQSPFHQATFQKLYLTKIANIYTTKKMFYSSYLIQTVLHSRKKGEERHSEFMWNVHGNQESLKIWYFCGALKLLGSNSSSTSPCTSIAVPHNSGSVWPTSSRPRFRSLGQPLL